MAKKETTNKKTIAGGYTAENITVLEGLDPVRKRPGMYIGTTGPDGLHHLVWEVFDNSRDEAMGGYADNIEVVLLPNNRIRVTDNGRGIPIDKHKQTKKSALETIMTTLHAGGKFGGEGYKVSGGLHGVGVSVVNALSVYAKAIIHKESGVYIQEYSRGKRKSEVKKIGQTKNTGTVIEFEPDPEIFPKIEFNWEKIVNHLRQQAYLVKGMRITILDAREENVKTDDEKSFYLKEDLRNTPSASFYFEGGLLSMVKFYNKQFKSVHKNIFYVEKNTNEYESVEISFQYVDDISSRILPFANNIYTSEGGTHITGFKTAITRTLNNYVKKNNLTKNGEDSFTGDDVFEGLTAIISVKIRDIQFEGQTKAKLGTVEARSAVDSVLSEALEMFLEENPDDAKAIIQKVTLALKARKAARAAKESVLRKGAMEGMTLPGKLADCQSGTTPEEAELFVVEGDSAGGCFVGNTKVALLDGREISFKQLVKEHKKGKKNYCYTIDKEGRVVVAPIKHPRITKKKAELVKVVLDNNEEIECTPDHKFMLRDGSYKQAKNLKSNDSLMPLYRKISKIGGKITISGYEMVMNPKGLNWVFTHRLAERMWRKRKTSEQWTDEFRRKRKEACNQTYKEKALRKLAEICEQKGRIDYREYDSIRKKTNDKSVIRADTVCSRFFEGDWKELEETVKSYNHKVKRVERIVRREDVYDIEVPGTHNFALASGVFVHNSGKMGRDRRTQAVLPLRGKILNIERARLDRALSSEQIKNLVIAIGAAIGDTFDISKLRYHKIIIATDADVDGAHIRTLLLTLFYRYFKPLVEGGYIYIALPPLYKIKKGKEVFYVYTEGEKDDFLKKEGITIDIEELNDDSKTEEEIDEKEKKKAKKLSFQRYKGLGEMNSDELWETTMDPGNRILKQVTVDDAIEADNIFDVLMGTDVPARKSFIQSNATKANIDI